MSPGRKSRSPGHREPRYPDPSHGTRRSRGGSKPGGVGPPWPPGVNSWSGVIGHGPMPDDPLRERDLDAVPVERRLDAGSQLAGRPCIGRKRLGLDDETDRHAVGVEASRPPIHRASSRISLGPGLVASRCRLATRWITEIAAVDVRAVRDLPRRATLVTTAGTCWRRGEMTPLGMCQTCLRRRAAGWCAGRRASTVPVAGPASMTSPTPYWSSMSMKMPDRKSRTRFWAPKPSGDPGDAGTGDGWPASGGGRPPMRRPGSRRPWPGERRAGRSPTPTTRCR